MLDYIKNEDAKYSRLYKNNWPDGPVRLACEILAPVLRKKYDNVLDCGCGLSTLRNYIKCTKYTGVDVSSYQIKKLNSKNKDKNLKFARCSLTEPLPYKENEFTCVFCLDVLEHIAEEYVEDVLKNMLRVSEEFIFSICLRKAKSKDKDGNQVHLTVKPTEWWIDKLKTCGYNIDCIKDGKMVRKENTTIFLKLSK